MGKLRTFSRQWRRAIIFGTGLITAVATQPAYAEERFCTDLAQCLDIVERHAPTEFDYDAIRQDFVRFGDPAKMALLRLAAGRDTVQSERALLLLRNGFRLTRTDQRILLGLWPRRAPDSVGPLLAGFATPEARNALIAMLDNPDASIAYAAKQNLVLGLKAKRVDMQTPLPPPLKNKLAIIAGEHAALLEFYLALGGQPDDAVMRRAQRQGDYTVRRKAFAALASIPSSNPNAVLNQITPTDVEGGMAIGQNGLPADFVSAVFEAPNAPLSHQVAALTAAIEGGFAPAVMTKTTDEILPAFEALIAASDNRLEAQTLVSAGLRAARQTPAMERLSRIAWQNAASRRSLDFKGQVLSNLAGLNAPWAQSLRREALNDTRNYKIVTTAISQLSPSERSSAEPVLRDMAAKHPISQVRVAAMQSLGQRAALFGVNRARGTCEPGPLMRGPLQPRPEFPINVLGLDAAYMTEAANRRKVLFTDVGWLVGYDFGYRGGRLIYHPTPEDEGVSLLEGRFLALYPGDDIRRPPRFDQPYSNRRYWGVTRSSGRSMAASIYLFTPSETGFEWREHVRLPASPLTVSRLDNGGVFIEFGPAGAHPPLVLSLSGALSPACARASAAIVPPSP